MEIKDFIEKLTDQFDDEVVINPDTAYRDLDEWSSLTALNVLMMIDEEYGVSLPSDEMRQTKTVQELFELVQSKL